MPGQASVAQHEGVNECDFLANLKAIAVGFTACVCASVWVCVPVCVRLCVCVCVRHNNCQMPETKLCHNFYY